jgi:hypothetical protein
MQGVSKRNMIAVYTYLLANKRCNARYFTLVADQGFAQVQFNYGICLRNGDDVSINRRSATQYVQLTANQEHYEAHFNYGICSQKDEDVSVEMLQIRSNLLFVRVDTFKSSPKTEKHGMNRQEIDSQLERTKKPIHSFLICASLSTKNQQLTADTTRITASSRVVHDIALLFR